MGVQYLVGDVFDRMAEMEDDSVDLVLTSPPFLALRSYLPADHPDKDREIGSEATPAEFVDVLLKLSAEWRRILTPHGSIVVELGDTYAGSGGAGGDYDPGGWREGQEAFEGSGKKHIDSKYERVQYGDKGPPIMNRHGQTQGGGPGWPLAKSLALVPESYRFALAYGINPHTGTPSPAGQWRIRNVVRWVRPNPPVGALGDKFRPATSEMVVACTSDKRWFDLDAVREPYSENTNARLAKGAAPRMDIPSRQRDGNWSTLPEMDNDGAGAPPLDWWKISPKGYAGAHYAVWPSELCVKPIEAMCPREVCRECGEPRRRITESQPHRLRPHLDGKQGGIQSGRISLGGYPIRNHDINPRLVGLWTRQLPTRTRPGPVRRDRDNPRCSSRPQPGRYRYRLGRTQRRTSPRTGRTIIPRSGPLDSGSMARSPGRFLRDLRKNFGDTNLATTDANFPVMPWGWETGSGFTDVREIGDGSRNSAVVGALNVLKNRFPEPPGRVFERNAEGEDFGEVVEPHNLTSLLEKPNPHMLGEELDQQVVAACHISGNAYWIKNRSAAGLVTELWPVMPSLMEPLATKGWTGPVLVGGQIQVMRVPDDPYIGLYRYTINGVETNFLPSDVVHFRLLGLDDEDFRHGFGPIKSVLRELVGDEAASQFQTALLKRVGMMGLIFTPKVLPDGVAYPSEAATNEMQSKITEDYGGHNRGSTFVAKGPYDVTVAQFSPDQMDLRTLHFHAEHRVASVLEVPAILAGFGSGVETSSGRSEGEALIRDFTNREARPAMETVRSEGYRVPSNSRLRGLPRPDLPEGHSTGTSSPREPQRANRFGGCWIPGRGCYAGRGSRGARTRGYGRGRRLPCPFDSDDNPKGDGFGSSRSDRTYGDRFRRRARRSLERINGSRGPSSRPGAPTTLRPLARGRRTANPILGDGYSNDPSPIPEGRETSP